MTESILNSVKKTLGIDAAYDAFDPELVIHTNSALSTLTQLGIGPVGGLTISDHTTTWDEFGVDDARLNSVKTYVYLKVRLVFDPPGTSYLIKAMEDQIRELEWRINVTRETEVVPPAAPGPA